VNNKLDQLWERASALDAAGDQAGATKLRERLLRREPWHIDASIRLASIDIFHGRYDEAIQRFERLSRVKRDVASVHTTLSTVYLFAHRRDEALASALQSVRLRPDDPWPHVILARALAARDDLDAAHAELERACGLRPSVVQQAEIQVEIGRVAEQQGKYEECSMHYRRAITLVPALALAHERLGEALLRLGRFERGWQEFEWRRHSPRFKSGMPPAPPKLYWTGSEDLHGKTIFVLNEQGLGDGIQFVRYLPQLKSLGAQVIYGEWSFLAPLVAASMPAVRVMTGSIQGLPIDYLCSVLSLPAAFRTSLETIPAKIPYLHADPERMRRWEPLLVPPQRCRVGLAWAGNPKHPNDARRSMPAQTLLGVTAAPGAAFYCLQHQLKESDRAAAESNGSVMRIGEMMADFADIAAIVAQLDLVITVDTSIAHLAGALGKPVWVLLPFVPEWRWLTGRDDSPWYPTARLFRQEIAGEWEPVVQRVTAELVAGKWRSD
jgi:tetratricopeptide (TPR) repeat protein